MNRYQYMNKGNPWKFLLELEQVDRSNNGYSLDYINNRIQELYPGNYRVIQRFSDFRSNYEIKFNSPSDELMTKLKYS